jgi:DNA-binding ferritin-like protein (Dps family)
MADSMTRIILLVLLAISSNIFSQNSNLFIPLDVLEAYENGTRTYDGTVSDSYWVNHTDYNIDVELFPDSGLLVGSAKIKYFNQSPDSLSNLVIRLYQNILKPGSIRDWNMPEKYLGKGIEVLSINVLGKTIDLNSKDVNVSGTNMTLNLPNKLYSNGEVELEIKWEFLFPERAIRMGNYEGDYFVGYWYPQISVYDDVYGWDVLQYSGTAEFYNDFNNYNINYKVPTDYVIWSTGDLQNFKTVFHSNIIERFEEAKKSDKTIRIITPEDYANNSVTINNDSGKNIWNFVANKVPDVAWAVSNNYNWDASSVEVEPGRRVLTAAVYPDSIEQNKNAAFYAHETIKYMSEVSPGIPYPWSHTTAFTNKKKGGGMEFPMIQNNGAPKSLGSSVGLIFHEIAHSYLPFYMGTNERRSAWMDEGWATFFPRAIVNKFDSTNKYQERRVASYEKVAGKTKDIPMIYPSYMMTHGESRNNFYNRPAIAYEELRHLLGDELFHKALREYMNRWHEKHPIGTDFFFTFNDVAGEDLSWFWNPWFFDLGYPDLALENVTVNENSATATVSMVGNLPTRIELTILFEDGETKVVSTSASQLKGRTKVDINFGISKKIKTVKLGSELIPDVNKENNLFEM